MEKSLYDIKIIEKINETKSRKSLLLHKICHTMNVDKKSVSDISREFDINYRTAKKLKDRYAMKQILSRVKIDRALRELLFTCPEQVELFDYLITDLNFFCKYDDVKTCFNISRYHYKKVKDYIQDELNALTK
jgi:hypothetical protein